jgi:hypothetical protein
MRIYLLTRKSEYSVGGYQSSYFEYSILIINPAYLLGNVYTAPVYLFFPPTHATGSSQEVIEVRQDLLGLSEILCELLCC